MSRKSELLSITSIVAMGIGTALYATFNVFFNIFLLPGGQLVSLRPSVAIPMFFGFVFGPIVGFISGFLGNIISDAISWGGFWWNWDVGNGLLGLIPGLVIFMIKKEEMSTRKGLILASILSIIASIIGIGFAAYTDYLFGYGIATIEEAIYILFLPAAVTDAINGAILTPILVAAYSAAIKGRAKRA